MLWKWRCIRRCCSCGI